MSLLSYCKWHELHTVTMATSATTGLEGPCSAEDWLCDGANQPSFVIVGGDPGDVLSTRSVHRFDDIGASSTRSAIFFLSAVASSATVFLAFAADSAAFLSAAFFSVAVLVLNKVAELQKMGPGGGRGGGGGEGGEGGEERRRRRRRSMTRRRRRMRRGRTRRKRMRRGRTRRKRRRRRSRGRSADDER